MPLASPGPGVRLALVQLPGRMRRALRTFRKITGLTAVTSLATSIPGLGMPMAASPPVHPACARRLRTVSRTPCSEQWSMHVRSGHRAQRAHSHTCPIGMRCSCVPIHFGGHLVGVAKLVADSGKSDSAFSAAIGVLELVVSRTCQDSVVTVLSEETRALRQRVADFQRMRPSGRPIDSHGPGDVEERNVALVDRILAYLQAHYHEPTLSLPAVARALRCNPRYLTTRFTQIVGEHMHAHLVALRVAHSCRLLLGTDQRVKEIAYASGFSASDRLARAFRKHLGVSPAEYRRIFAGP
jgi:AraC-like DNA-binding protein